MWSLERGQQPEPGEQQRARPRAEPNEPPPFITSFVSSPSVALAGVGSAWSIGQPLVLESRTPSGVEAHVMLEQMRRSSQSLLIYVLFGIVIAVFIINFGPQSTGGCESATRMSGAA